MSDIAIRAEGLGKKYRIGSHERYKTLRDSLAEAVLRPARAVRSLFRGNGFPTASGEEMIWALKDVSFDVKHGEVVGVIGRNGAGKSTLLKILSRITEPTEGYAEIHGRVGSLLEVGTGFHPELTGRENIYLNGAILGMKRVEIEHKFDEIVAFAEVEKFIDTPVKHYSSGMYLRLAFAVAAHLDPEILLVDEVLAVGDAQFQNKCLGKMKEVAGRGRTVLFVSHNLGAVQRLCQTAVWLESGSLMFYGGPFEAIQLYQSQLLSKITAWRRPEGSTTEQEFAFLSAALIQNGQVSNGVFAGDEAISLRLEYFVNRELSACAIGARVYNQDGVPVFTTSDADTAGVSALAKPPGVYSTAFTIPGRLLAPGSYYVYLGAHMPQRCVYDVIEQAVTFEITSGGSLQSLDGRFGIVTLLLPWTTNRKDHL